jgi:tetratricopeptide (TPR) repeat protein
MALYTLAACYEHLGDKEKATKSRALASKKRIVDIFPYRLGEIAVLEAALRANGADATASYLLGCELYDKRHYERAASLWKDAIRDAPDFYIPYRCLAVACYSHLDRRDEVLPLLLKANELYPHDEQLLTETSYVMAHLGVQAAERAAFLTANKPVVIHGALALELENAFNAAGEYDKAMELLTTHTFLPGEGGEFAVGEPYMFNRLTLGRLALAEGDAEKALGYIENILNVPENLHASFWNDSVLVPFEYHYAEALMKAGRRAEAEEKLRHISTLTNKGMWAMGGEFEFYSAMAARLAGNEAQGRAIMRSAVLSWEAQLENDDPGASGSTPFYISFCEDPRTERRAALCFMLGYGKLFFGDAEGARELFTESLRLDPSNLKCALELKLLK